MRKRIVLLTGLVVLGLTIGGIATAMTVTSVNITNNPASFDYHWTTTSGNFVAFDSDLSDDGTYRIYLYDITTQETGMISGANDYDAGAPEMDGNNVVYTQLNSDLTESIIVKDTKGTVDSSDDVTKVVFTGTYSGTDDDGYVGQRRPMISGNYVVFRDNPGRQWNIYYVDISGDGPYTPVQCGTSTGNHAKPDISGNYVVYHTGNPWGSTSHVWLYDIATDTEVEIPAPDGMNAYRPTVSGDKIAMMAYDYTATSDDMVYMYDITNATTTRISPVGNDTFWTTIGGSEIIYEDDGTGSGTFLSSYNIATGITTAITEPDDDASYPEYPSVSGNHVAWVHSPDGPKDVYLATLSGAPAFVALPGVDQPINITEGQTITVNPFVIQVKPTGDFGIAYVEFYIDGVLIGTSAVPDANGVYSMNWDTSLYHSIVTVRAYDTLGESTDIVRNTTVALQLPYTGK
jgi:hypothetical protein